MTIRAAILLATALIALFAPVPVQVFAYTGVLIVVLATALVRVGYRIAHPRHRRYCR